MSKTFLTAEWRKLAMANYSISPDILKSYLPPRTEIDTWNGACYVSLIGFMFQQVKLKGVKIPFHVNFEEVNLRFYVRYNDNGNWKRGVVFIKEIVPKPALTFVARTLYNEKYQTLPMSHSWTSEDDRQTIEYKWKKGKWHSLRIRTSKNSSLIQSQSEEEFITEHYWGYTKLANNKTSEYGVEHPQWEVYQTIDYSIDVDFGAVYGPEFSFLTRQEPKSVFLAEGSAIEVKTGRVI